MKRVFAFFVAVVLILPLCGCSGGEPLTKQEYYDEVIKRMRVQGDAIWEIVYPLYEYETNGIPFDKDKLKEHCETAEKALEEIKELKPPSDYKEIRSELCDAVDTQLVYLDSINEAIDAKSKAEFSVAYKKMLESADKSKMAVGMSKFIIATLDDVE